MNNIDLDWTTIIAALISLMGILYATFSTRKTNKEGNQEKMLERSQNEIVRLDDKNVRLEKDKREMEKKGLGIGRQN